MGRPWMAVCAGAGNAGVKLMPPAANTPLETVMMARLARRPPQSPEATTPGPDQSSRVTAWCSRTGSPSASRATRPPTPSRGRRLGPSSSVLAKSSSEMPLSSAALIWEPSQCAMVAFQGPPLGAAFNTLRSGFCGAWATASSKAAWARQ